MRVLVMAARDAQHPQRAGGDLTLWEVARHLSLRGDDVRFVASTFTGAPKVETVEGIEVHRMGGPYTAAPRVMVQYLRRWRSWPDVIVEEAIGGLRWPYAAPLYAKAPVVSFWYQDNTLIFRYQFGAIPARFLRAFERSLAAIHSDSYIMTCSTRSKQALVEMGFSPDRIRIYYPGAPESLIRIANESADVRREALLVAIGKIRRYKCFHHAVLALSGVRRSFPGARLVIAGRREDTHYENELRSLAESLGIGDGVSVEIDVTENRKAELLRSARALLITSPTEGFGLTGIEANLFGTPVVASDGVASEVVEDRVTGIRVPFGDVAAMADGCRLLLTDDAAFARMSQAARTHASGFTWKNAMGPIIETIEKAARIS